MPRIPDHALRTRIAAGSCILFITLPFVAAAQQPAAPDASDRATMQTLLIEVRQLRMALERSTSLLPRVQVTAQRLQAQQDRVDRLSRELRDWRRQMADHAAERDGLAAAIKQMDEQVTQDQDPMHRKEMAEAKKQINLRLAPLSAREAQERAEEIDLLSQLQSEQAKLNALSEQLDSLEKSLQAPATQQ